PGYEQKAYTDAEKRGRLRLVASPDGNEGSVRIHQDARMHAGLFDGDEQAALDIAPGRLAYVHLARGRALVNGRDLSAGDAVLYADEPRVEIERGDGAEVRVFDLPRLQYDGAPPCNCAIPTTAGVPSACCCTGRSWSWSAGWPGSA